MSTGRDNGYDDRYTITARDLLQANATIIAGVLILLTIAASAVASSDIPFTLTDVIIVSAGTIPFVVSCIFLLEEYSKKEHGFRLAKRITYFGMIFLVGVIAYFLGLIQYRL